MILDTIVAPATPLGRSALAIVRIDGPAAVDILQQLTGGRPAVRQATLTHLPFDECVVIRYEAPHSFTGNDLVELNLHGNPLPLLSRPLGPLRRARSARSVDGALRHDELEAGSALRWLVQEVAAVGARVGARDC